MPRLLTVKVVMAFESSLSVGCPHTTGLARHTAWETSCRCCRLQQWDANKHTYRGYSINMLAMFPLHSTSSPRPESTQLGFTGACSHFRTAPPLESLVIISPWSSSVPEIHHTTSVMMLTGHWLLVKQKGQQQQRQQRMCTQLIKLSGWYFWWRCDNSKAVFSLCGSQVEWSQWHSSYITFRYTYTHQYRHIYTLIHT